MGFWSWLFGLGRKDEIDTNVPEILPPNTGINIQQPEKREVKRRLYSPRPLTKEDIAFVQEMSNKAKMPDPKITPFVDNTNPKDIEKITTQLKDKLAKKR